MLMMRSVRKHHPSVHEPLKNVFKEMTINFSFKTDEQCYVIFYFFTLSVFLFMFWYVLY